MRSCLQLLEAITQFLANRKTVSNCFVRQLCLRQTILKSYSLRATDTRYCTAAEVPRLGI